MGTTAPTSLPVIHLDTLSFVGLERSHLRSAVYRRVFGDDAGPVRIGRYSLLERVGSGARGVVFKAFDNQLDRLVALKVLSARADDHEELIREAKALARLSHPNVLPVYEVGETEEGQVFLATEYVKGWTLRGWYDEETRGEAAIVEVIQQVARGVQAAHDEGLVHRDLKPANILLGEDGRARVADFGLARFDPTALEPAAGIPRDGLATTTAGTPGYMAPELFRGGAASAASDQYALAVTLHELLFGALPDEASSAALRRASKTVSTAVRRALADAPEHRFPTVGAFADALVSAARSPLRRRVPWLVGLSALAATAATIWVADPLGERQADNDIARLRAQAALPDDPAAAIEELRNAPDLSDERLLPIAERALALGPERARYALPTGAHDIFQLGGILVFRDAQDGLAALQLSPQGLKELEPAAIGLALSEADPSLPLSFQRSLERAVLGDAPALFAIDPRAAQNFARDRPRLALSEDGRRVARASDEGRTVSVQDAATGEVLWSQGVGPNYIKSVSLDVAGNRVAWTESDGAGLVYNLSTGATSQLEPAASDVLFEGEGDSVIVKGRFTGVYQTDFATTQTIRLLEENESFARVELASTGSWLAALSGDEITVTDLAASVPRVLEGSSFEFSPDGKRIAVLAGEHIKIHDLASSEVQTFSATGGVSSFDFADDRTLWVVGGDGYVRRHNVSATRALEGHTARIRDLALSADGSVALSLAQDFTLRRWNVETGAGRVLVELQTDPGRLALDEGANRIALTHRTKTTRLIDLETGTPLGEAPNSRVRPVIGPGGALFGAGTTGVWRNLDGETTALAAELEDCSNIAASPQWVAAVCEGKEQSLHVWTGDQHTSLPLTGRMLGSSMHAWPDENHIYVIAEQERLVRRSDSGALELLAPSRLVGEAQPFSFRAVSTSSSNSAHDLVVLRPGGVHSRWNTTEEPVLLFETAGTSSVAISGDGLRIAYATGHNKIVVRDRGLSKARPTLSAALDASSDAGGES